MILLPEGRHTITYFGNYHFETGEVFPGTSEALAEPLDLPHQATIEITVVDEHEKGRRGEDDHSRQDDARIGRR